MRVEEGRKNYERDLKRGEKKRNEDKTRLNNLGEDKKEKRKEKTKTG